MVSVAAGIRADTLAGWLGTPEQPFRRLVRCMPNTPALVGAGMTGLAALDGVGQEDRELAASLLASVGDVVWVADDAALDGVTALSGSGPAYVPVPGSADRRRPEGRPDGRAGAPAQGTLAGAASSRPSRPSRRPSCASVSRQGGTTAAALASFGAAGFAGIVEDALAAAAPVRASWRRNSANERAGEPLRSHARAAVRGGGAVYAAGGGRFQHPVQVPLNDWLTWGGLSYPVAFLVTDVLNRRFGPSAARRVAWFGFAAALVVSFWVASPRIAASVWPISARNWSTSRSSTVCATSAGGARR